MRAAFRVPLFLHVIDSSGAADLLEAAIRTSRRGRPRTCPTRTFLVLLLLAAADGELTIERMRRIAIEELPRSVQTELGIIRPRGDRLVELPISDLYYLSRTITRKLSWTGPAAADLDDDERDRRQSALQEIVDRLIRATLPPRPGSSFALDESAIWAWSRGRRRLRNAAADSGAALSACPDARWGTKTGKNGEQDAYFGYALHALVRVPDLKPGPSFSDADDPVLIEAIAVTPASTDIVDVSLAILDRVRAHQSVRDLIADRHYSYKEWSRWARELWARGIHPVADLRADEHGFRDYNGTRIAASWPHCPATPTALAELPRPGSNATQRAKSSFHAKISKRRAFAMRRVNSHVPNGATRWECPARAGTLGCPLVAGSVEAARQLDQPVVTRPPRDHAHLACCTQRTFMIRVEEPDAADGARTRAAKQQLALAMKHSQDEYWGDHRWVVSWNRRTYVEGAFGNLKNPNTENVHRGLFRFTGLPLVSLAVAASVTASDVRQLRNWNSRTAGDAEGNLLLTPPAQLRAATAYASDHLDDLGSATSTA